MIECLLVLSVLSVIMLITARKTNDIYISNTEYKVNELVMDQYAAINECQRMENEYTSFNRKGNVRNADTIHIDGKDIIISLGTGRIYEKE